MGFYESIDIRNNYDLTLSIDRNAISTFGSRLLPWGECFYGPTYKCFSPEKIKKVEFYPPATKVTFSDGTVTTVSARGEDEFDEYTGIILCIMEYIFKGKTYNNMIRKWIKKAEEEKMEKEKALKDAEERKKIKEHQRKKKAAKKLLRKQARMEEAIEIQKEAYLRAMEEKERA